MISEEIDSKLQLKNIKPTAMRQLVLRVLTKQKKAINLNEIEQHFDNVDRSTLFRTLKTFQDNNLIHSIDDGTGSVKYALCEDSCTCEPEYLHVHFLCQKCGQTFCFKDLPVPQPKLPEGFDFDNANFVVKGTCSSCR